MKRGYVPLTAIGGNLKYELFCDTEDKEISVTLSPVTLNRGGEYIVEKAEIDKIMDVLDNLSTEERESALEDAYIENSFKAIILRNLNPICEKFDKEVENVMDKVLQEFVEFLSRGRK